MTKDDWKNITEELPQESSDILVCTIDGYFYVCDYDGEKKEFILMDTKSEEVCKVHNVIYWQYVEAPTLPKDPNKKPKRNNDEG